MNLYEFEETYKDILENIEEWAYLRVPFGEMLQSELEQKSYKVSFIKKIYNHLKKIKFIFYGFKNWFRKYDGLVFSDSAERRFLQKQYFDKTCDDIIDKIGSDILLIELPNPNHYDIQTIKTNNIVSHSSIDFLLNILNIFFANHASLVSLEECIKSENLVFNYKKVVKSFKNSYRIYKLILKVYLPKYILVNCYYCRPALIKVANDLNIKVIEIQHGVINEAHFAYNSMLKLNSKYYPNYLLSFGYNEVYLKNKLIKNVYPVGSFYLEYLQNHFHTDKELLKKVNNYKYIVGVSIQDQHEWEINSLFNFIKNCADLDKNIVYLMIPRRMKQFEHNLPSNIIIFDRIDCYNTILHCDLHVTLYSSCALEAPSLGIPNILIDIKGFSTAYYKNILSDKNTSFILDTKDFIDEVYRLSKLDKDFIKKENKNIFGNNYSERIDKFLKGALKNVKENK